MASTKMIDWKDIGTVLISAGVIALEELIKHPIGGLSAIVGLLFVYERWRTQRLITKLKQKEYEEFKPNGAFKERKERAQD